MKKTTDTAFSEVAAEVEAKVEETTTPASAPEEAAPDDKIFVYLGPNVGGLIQKGTIYHGKDIDSIPDLALPIEKIPKIRQLIIEDIYIREVQKKLNSDENNAYTIAEKAIIKAAVELDAAKK